MCDEEALQCARMCVCVRRSSLAYKWILKPLVAHAARFQNPSPPRFSAVGLHCNGCYSERLLPLWLLSQAITFKWGAREHCQKYITSMTSCRLREPSLSRSTTAFLKNATHPRSSQRCAKSTVHVLLCNTQATCKTSCAGQKAPDVAARIILIPNVSGHYTLCAARTLKGVGWLSVLMSLHTSRMSSVH